MSRIATNVSALNTWRNLSLTNSALSKSLERLSSGFRINRAADDAAGLAISEKMRGQIAGLNMAVKNAQDGISLIQTGEGALNEVHAMLKRMEELAVQAANDTNTPEDRAKLQAEMDQLAQEVARIGSTTEFNTLKLLDGTFETKDIVFHIGANEDQNLRIRISDMRSKALDLAATTVGESWSGTVDLDPDGDSTNGAVPADGTYAVSYDSGTSEWSFTAGTTTFTSTDGATFTDGATDPVNIVFSQALPTTNLGTVTISGTGTAAAYSSPGGTGTNNGLEAGIYVAQLGELQDQNGTPVAVWDATATAYVDPTDA
ncbi:MAG: flagellin, partial [Candidatus Thermoplasmatota archaeon]|nr:flagellin [Candidatus Thermoplasmatota archaeon]